MARPASPIMSPSAWSRLRSKEGLIVLVAGLFVLTLLRFGRENSQIPKEADWQQLVPSIGGGVGDQATASSPPLPITAGDASGWVGSKRPPATPPANRPLAVIIETEEIPTLIPIMLHFATVLGPTWTMILFTLQDTWIEPLSPAFQRLVAAGLIEVRFMPAGTSLSSSLEVSRFLTSPWLWEQVEAAERVLLFQTDSILCSRAEARVEDFFEYDYIGSPITESLGHGYNGGLSVRNPRMFLNITRTVNFTEGFEDQFFYGELLKVGANMPPPEVAMTFGVETMFYETPLGYHQPQRWQPDMMDDIEQWCPEVKMLIGRRAM